MSESKLKEKKKEGSNKTITKKKKKKRTSSVLYIVNSRTRGLGGGLKFRTEGMETLHTGNLFDVEVKKSKEETFYLYYL